MSKSYKLKQRNPEHDEKLERMNGEMASNLKEMKRLGKEMERIETNQQVKNNGGIPSPKQ